MEIDEYRKQIQREIESAAEQEQAAPYKDFLDRRRTTAQRMRAFRAAGTSDLMERQQTIDLIRDESEDTRLRIAALGALSSEIGRRQSSLDVLLDVLLGDTQPVELRRAALAGLRQASFSSPVFATIRPEYMAALRTVIDDADRELREAALEVLAEEHDEYGQRRLLEGLENPKQALVPAAKAIQLLSYDIHAEHYPILRQLVERPPSLSARREAISLLATDSQSRELLAGIMGDRNERSDIRRTAAVALRSLAPAEWEQLARRIVLDDGEDALLRAQSVSALAHFSGSAPRSGEAGQGELRRHVEQLSQTSPSRPLRQAANRYLEITG